MSSLKLRITIDNSHSFLDKFFTFLVAVAPILQHYKGLLMNGGVTVLIISLPYTLLKIFLNKRIVYRDFSLLLPILPFLLFKVIDHGTYVAEIGQVVFIVVYSLAFCLKALDTKMFVRIVWFISCLASILIVVQYICYYILGFHLRLIPTSMLLSDANQWIALAQTGRVGISGKISSLYRPSSFFLEPSHMFLYLFPALIYYLLPSGLGTSEKRKAVIISIGIVLSTSGMGLVVVAGVWILYFAKNGQNNSRFSLTKLLRPRNLLRIAFIILVIILLYYRVNPFRQSINRIISSAGLQSSINGRTALGNSFIRRMHGSQFLFGISDRYSDIDFNMSGFNGTMFKYGIIGTCLSYLFYLKCLFDLKNQHFWIAIVIISVSFFSAHTHGTFYMLFYIVFLTDGYCYRSETMKRDLLKNR